MTLSSISDALLARRDDETLGLRTRTQDWTWAEVVRESAARGKWAAELRVDGPFHIGVLLDNVPEFAFWLGGAALSGATIAGLNPTRGDAELSHEISHTECQLIVTDSKGAARLAALDLSIAADRVLNIDTDEYRAAAEHYLSGTTEDDLRVADGVDENTLFLLLFTSGTTGRSKAVKCSQGRLYRVAQANVTKFGHHPGDIDYCCMPMFHGNALMSLWAPGMLVGATICLTPKFSASGFMPDVRFFKATFFTYVGKALGYLMATPEQPDDGDNTLERGFGTEASPGDRAEFVRRFNAELMEGYGSSEGGGSVKIAPDAPAGALGRPAHEGIRVVDPETRETRPPARLDAHGRVLNPDEAIGEMVNTRGARDFEGYWRNDAADAERIRHGWYWTGDLGYIDEAGFIYFAGRKGDWIRVDGENTSALMIEHVIRRHPDVIAAAVFGVPDPRSGDQVMAAIEVADVAAFDVAEFTAFLADQADLGSKATPRFLRVSDNLPVTGSNKVLKRDLQADKWHTEELVLRWVGRTAPEYHAMDQAEKDALDAEFAEHGRSRFLH